MKKVLIISYLLTLVLQVEAQNKVYTDDKGMITLNKSGDVTMICKGNNGMVSEQISFPNEKGAVPMATTFNKQGLPSCLIANGEKVNLQYDANGQSVTVEVSNKEGKRAKYKVKLAENISGYQAPGIFGMMDKGLSKVSSAYGKQLNKAANIIDAINNVVGLNWTTGASKNSPYWMDKLGGFIRSNKSNIAEQVLTGSGVTPVEIFSDMSDYIKGGISSGLIVGKSLLSVVANYNSWKKSWSDFVYERLDDDEFLDRLYSEGNTDFMLLTGDEWEAFKKEKRAQWEKEDQEKLIGNQGKLEELNKQLNNEGQELIEGFREKAGQAGPLITPSKAEKKSSGKLIDL